ncbi:hypothetical protein CCM_06166 [Cordyceps militaris CM01]|uniref:Uncharacterized protein n=1 Tax=Cordyceps militaris (strain CM01) TaxID=983644 RepID=G3JJ64_CORMM|nr:uncharacterized protein CCM_06166 [Cordyceps militaris CM01]EGX92006.1 hypothetical protein CCM_06166 [Cordyceps militaris CM01]
MQRKSQRLLANPFLQANFNLSGHAASGACTFVFSLRGSTICEAPHDKNHLHDSLLLAEDDDPGNGRTALPQTAFVVMSSDCFFEYMYDALQNGFATCSLDRDLQKVNDGKQDSIRW